MTRSADVCTCGHARDDHGRDHEHPASASCAECDCIVYIQRTRGGARPGAGRHPVSGTPQTERVNLTMTEAERAEIVDAVPDGAPVGRWIVAAALMRARGQLQ